MTDEKEKTISRQGISRRQFIAGTVGGVVVGAAAGAVAGSLGFPTIPASVSQPWLPASWDQTADVVVVGYGGAGAVAAITAFDSGAHVLVLEKTPSLASLGVSATSPPNPTYAISGGGGNTHTCGGACAYTDDPTDFAQYVYSCEWGETPLDVCEAYATMVSQNKAWLDNLGLKYTAIPNAAQFPGLPGASSYTMLLIDGSGAALFQKLDQAVQSKGIPVLFNTQGTDLIQNPITKEILGVKALSNSKVMNFRANKAVVLCTGGFERNDAMLANNLKCYPTHNYGWQYNTGDGISMAQKAGAGLWHMNGMVGSPAFWTPEEVSSYSISVPNNAYIYVNKYGQRFIAETSLSGDSSDYYFADFNLNMAAGVVPEYTRIPMFIIMDDTTIKAGPLGTSGPMSFQGVTMNWLNVILPPQVGGIPYWSSDNSAEIAKGWIIGGVASIADLANAINSAKLVSSTWEYAHPISINIDPAVLSATVDKWNADCAAGSGDTVFGRLAKTMSPISTPPFYALPLWPTTFSTQGGPIRNANAQVCDPDGNPIPHLYSAGELGCILGYLYPGMGGGDVADFIGFGQIAGKNAAAETSWT